MFGNFSILKIEVYCFSPGSWSFTIVHQNAAVMCGSSILIPYSMHKAKGTLVRKSTKSSCLYSCFEMGSRFQFLGESAYRIYKLFFTKQKQSRTATNKSNQLILRATCQKGVQSFVGFLGLQTYITCQKTCRGQVHPSIKISSNSRKTRF